MRHLCPQSFAKDDLEEAERKKLQIELAARHKEINSQNLLISVLYIWSGIFFCPGSAIKMKNMSWKKGVMMESE